MGYLDRVRFVAGDEQEDAPVKVWQGFDAASTNGSAGFAMVYVTAETLRQMADVDWDIVKDDAFGRLHNAPEGFWNRLAFGGDHQTGTNRPDAITAPDGVTPLYLVGEWTVVIVQRFNPNGGKTYDVVTVENGVERKIGERHWGAWENEAELTGIPDPVGFVYNPEAWEQGRSDTPPFARIEDEAEEKVALVGVTFVYSDGNRAEMSLEPEPEGNELSQSGTTYHGPMPVGHSAIEDAVSTAVAVAGLWPER